MANQYALSDVLLVICATMNGSAQPFLFLSLSLGRTVVHCHSWWQALYNFIANCTTQKCFHACIEAIHGYSLASVSCPPTILVPFLAMPHTVKNMSSVRNFLNTVLRVKKTNNATYKAASKCRTEYVNPNMSMFL